MQKLLTGVKICFCLYILQNTVFSDMPSQILELGSSRLLRTINILTAMADTATALSIVVIR